MMIVMKEDATREQIVSVVKRVENVGAHAHVSEGELLTVIGAIGDRERIANLDLDGAPGVDRVVPITKPYKLASRQFKHGESTIVEVHNNPEAAICDGPQAVPADDFVEYAEQLQRVAAVVGNELSAL